METSCCGAAFYEPGYPDSDICTACGEHAGAEECSHKTKFYQAEEQDTNTPESLHCDDCGEELNIDEPDWDSMAKDYYQKG